MCRCGRCCLLSCYGVSCQIGSKNSVWMRYEDIAREFGKKLTRNGEKRQEMTKNADKLKTKKMYQSRKGGIDQKT